MMQSTERPTTLVAAIQMAAGPQVHANLLEAERLIAQAAQQGAKLVVLPEAFMLMGHSEQDKLNAAEADRQGPVQQFLSSQAALHGIWLVGGTVFIHARAGRVAAACLLFNAEGERVARYDKIHLFDADLGEKSEQHNESRSTQPGDQVLVVDTPFGRLGFAVCYDLRFPELFRILQQQGAEILLIPSAFTAITGKAHWEVLTRARAIENLCYVIAANQGGYHSNGRETYGDSMIVDPWGQVLARQAKGSGVILAPVDLNRIQTVRKTLPAAQHCRLSLNYCQA